MNVVPTVTLYSRVDCHLCEVAKAALDELRAEASFDLQVVDLDSEASAEKRSAYDQEVPVIEIDGKKAMKYTVDRARFLRLLKDSSCA